MEAPRMAMLLCILGPPLALALAAAIAFRG
jgi:hypothetical protein